MLDTQLLVLLLVGSTDRGLIRAHRRLQAYTSEDYDLLEMIVASSRRVIVTPNVLTEASNLIRQIAEPHRSRIAVTFRALVSRTEEAYVASAQAASSEAFVALGLADAASLEVARDASLLTADLDLYLAAVRAGSEATNFHYLREEYGTLS